MGLLLDYHNLINQIGNVMSDIRAGDTVYCMQWVNDKERRIGFSAYVYNVEGNKARIRIVKFLPPRPIFDLSPPTLLIGQSFNNYTDIHMSYENVGKTFWIDTWALSKKLPKEKEDNGCLVFIIIIFVIYGLLKYFFS